MLLCVLLQSRQTVEQKLLVHFILPEEQQRRRKTTTNHAWLRLHAWEARRRGKKNSSNFSSVSHLYGFTPSLFSSSYLLSPLFLRDEWRFLIRTTSFHACTSVRSFPSTHSSTAQRRFHSLDHSSLTTRLARQESRRERRWVVKWREGKSFLCFSFFHSLSLSAAQQQL